MAVVRVRLEQGDADEALHYLDALSASPALQDTRQICKNEIVNAVLIAKTETMWQAGIIPDISASVPVSLPHADTNLCALWGNAPGNAMEAAAQAEEKTVIVRCEVHKGLFILQVENVLNEELLADLSTTKADKSAHGLGLPSMREIALRNSGTLETSVRDGKFALLICIPLVKAGL